jgi:hypothetical protein
MLVLLPLLQLRIFFVDFILQQLKKSFAVPLQKGDENRIEEQAEVVQLGARRRGCWTLLARPSGFQSEHPGARIHIQYWQDEARRPR